MRMKLRTILLYTIVMMLVIIIAQQYSYMYRPQIPVMDAPRADVEVTRFTQGKPKYETLFNYFRKQPNDTDVVYVKRVQIKQLTIKDSWRVIQNLNRKVEMEAAYLEEHELKPWWYNYPKRKARFPTEKRQDPKSPTPKEFFGVKTEVNRRGTHYWINQPHICNAKHMFLLITIMSEAISSPMRMAIRATWGRLVHAYGHDIRFVFMLGSTASTYHQSLVEAEGAQYHDIVQGSFNEAYHMLTDKTLMTLQWAAKFCTNTKYVLKINDNVIINPYKLVRYLERLNKRDLYWGKVVYLDTPQDKVSGDDHYMSNVTWTGKTFPPYCLRPHIIMSIKTLQEMAMMSIRTPWVFPDDIYLGILAEKLGRQPYDFSRGIGKIQYGLDPATVLANSTSSLMIVETHDSGQMTSNQHRFWSSIRENMEDQTGFVLNQREIEPVVMGDVYIET